LKTGRCAHSAAPTATGRAPNLRRAPELTHLCFLRMTQAACS
jgi:hypothetical protein